MFILSFVKFFVGGVLFWPLGILSILKLHGHVNAYITADVRLASCLSILVVAFLSLVRGYSPWQSWMYMDLLLWILSLWEWQATHINAVHLVLLLDVLYWDIFGDWVCMVAETLVHFLVMQWMVTENSGILLRKFLLHSHLLLHELQLLLFLHDYLSLIVSHIK